MMEMIGMLRMKEGVAVGVAIRGEGGRKMETQWERRREMETQ